MSDPQGPIPSSSAIKLARQLLIAVGVALVFLFAAFKASATAQDDECESAPTRMGERIEGTSCADVIVAPDGVEAVDGGGGADTIVAGSDVVEITGGPGDDELIGGPDVTYIAGGDGDDTIFGDHAPPGTDIPAKDAVVSGGAVATASSEPIYLGDLERYVGGSGNDVVFGQRGNDSIEGHGGNDRLFGSVGDDLLNGGPGDDLLAGGNGSDSALGGDDNDLIRGDTIGDIRNPPTAGGPMEGLHGGSGTDTLSYATAITPGFRNADVPSNPSNTYSGFPEEYNEASPDSVRERGVYIDLGRNVQVSLGVWQTVPVAENGKNKDGGGGDIVDNDFENIIGSPYADYIRGNVRDNVIVGGGGGDVIVGNDGNDTLYGGGHGDDLRGGAGTNTIHGGSGSNYCANPGPCERTTTGVFQRYANLLGVGFVETRWGSGPQAIGAYLLGTDTADAVEVTYYSGSWGHKLVFVSTGVTTFENRPADGCTNDTTKITTCILPTSKTLDAIEFYGSTGNDSVTVNGAQLPFYTSPFMLGGPGADPNISGGNNTEDVLIDGPSVDDRDDNLYSFGQTDALLQGLGSDDLEAGDHGDTLLSADICEGNILDGGEGSDNASWASVPTGARRSMTRGVFADLPYQAVAGQYGWAGDYSTGENPACIDDDPNAAEELDALPRIENIEGTNGRDKLTGNDHANQLLGRAGPDVFNGNGGDDKLLTYSDDDDPWISCGESTGDIDELMRDPEEPGDSHRDREGQLGSCADDPARPLQDMPTDYPSTPVDAEMMCVSGANAFWRLNERSGTTVYPTRGGLQGTYNGGIPLHPDQPGVVQPGAIADTEDSAVALDGNDDWIGLNTGLDPFANDYTIELWVKFPQAAPDAGLRYVFSKRAAGTLDGVFLKQEAGLLTFGSTRSGTTFSASAPTINDSGSQGGPKWHHLVGTLASDERVRLYIDGVEAATSAQFADVSPGQTAGVANRIGTGPNEAGKLLTQVDNVAIYSRALSQTEVSSHYALATPGTAGGVKCG